MGDCEHKQYNKKSTKKESFNATDCSIEIQHLDGWPAFNNCADIIKSNICLYNYIKKWNFKKINQCFVFSITYNLMVSVYNYIESVEATMQMWSNKVTDDNFLIMLTKILA